jgi:alpha-methylacyl-CoA racemase
VAARLKTGTRAHWCAVLEGTDACFAPVLDFDEAATHPHLVARGTLALVEGRRQPAPAPRLSRTPARSPAAGPWPGQHTDAVLAELGMSLPQASSKK